MKWVCIIKCKPLIEAEVSTIVELKEAFDKPIQEVCHALDVCDSDYPNQLCTKFAAVDLQGHPLVCSNDGGGGGCHNKLRILRLTAMHFPVLYTLLCLVYSAVNSHKCVQDIDNALCSNP